MAQTKEIHNQQSHNIIAGGTLIKGEITTEGDFRIDGTVEGTINSKGKVIIGDKGVFTGTMNAQNIEIIGSANGTLTAAELLSLRSLGKIKGDIITKTLIIEQGAEFNGTCKMGSGKEEPQQTETKKK